MKNSRDRSADQVANAAPAMQYDPHAAGLGILADDHSDSVLSDYESNIADELFGKEGPQPDGTVFLPKITMATIRANPERCKLTNPPGPMKMALITGIAGGEILMPPVGDENRIMDLGPDHPEYITFSALRSALEPWGCVRFDDSGEPGAVFKSEVLFLPTGHNAVVLKRREAGQIAIALELWAQPAKNPLGYSWYYHNLAKHERGISYIDRMLILGVRAGRQIVDKREPVGLLADLRSR